jgi:phage gp45-like
MMDKLRAMVTRGRVALAVLNPKRTLVQLSGLAEETKDKIELMLPHGMSARPKKGADLILLQVGASRAHLVALCADDPALRIQDLQEGEFGFRDANGQQVVFRQDKLEVTTPLKLVMTITGNLEQTVNGQTILTCNDVQLGAAGGKKVVLDGDPVVGGGGGHVQASSTKVRAT